MARGFPGDADELDAELLVGLVEAVGAFEPGGGHVAARLLTGPWSRAKRARRAAEADFGRHVGLLDSLPPPPPFGHSELVLAKAVALGVVSGEEAELIAATRLGGRALHQVADEAGETYGAIRRRRWKAERRLVQAIAEDRLDPGSPKRPPVAFGGCGTGRGGPGPGQGLRRGPRDKGGDAHAVPRSSPPARPRPSSAARCAR